MIHSVMQTLVRSGMFLLEALFFAGCMGSLVVVVISGIEDLETIFQKDTELPGASTIGGDHDLR